MELLLNLAWLLLALPAYFLWRGCSRARTSRKLNSLQCLFALGCLLVVLFPVVSATDDLRAMRAEMEESPCSKRTIRQASNDKTSPWKWQSTAALAASTGSLIVLEESWQQLPPLYVPSPAAPAIERGSRAPPASFPG